MLEPPWSVAVLILLTIFMIVISAIFIYHLAASNADFGDLSQSLSITRHRWQSEFLAATTPALPEDEIAQPLSFLTRRFRGYVVRITPQIKDLSYKITIELPTNIQRQEFTIAAWRKSNLIGQITRIEFSPSRDHLDLTDFFCLQGDQDQIRAYFAESEKLKIRYLRRVNQGLISEVTFTPYSLEALTWLGRDPFTLKSDLIWLTKLADLDTKPNILLKASLSSLHCPFCRTEIYPEFEPIANCIACGTAQHQECFDESGRCTVLGCTASTVQY